MLLAATLTTILKFLTELNKSLEFKLGRALVQKYQNWTWPRTHRLEGRKFNDISFNDMHCSRDEFHLLRCEARWLQSSKLPMVIPATTLEKRSLPPVHINFSRRIRSSACVSPLASASPLVWSSIVIVSACSRTNPLSVRTPSTF